MNCVCIKDSIMLYSKNLANITMLNVMIVTTNYLPQYSLFLCSDDHMWWPSLHSTVADISTVTVYNYTVIICVIPNNTFIKVLHNLPQSLLIVYQLTKHSWWLNMVYIAMLGFKITRKTKYCTFIYLNSEPWHKKGSK